MNQKLEGKGNLVAQNLKNGYSILPGVFHLLRLSHADTNIASDFNQIFEICEFQLGEQFVNYSVPHTSNNLVHGKQYEQNNCSFYIVCQGRVRLLGFDAQQEREVSALVLEAGETFGANELLCNLSELTRAVNVAKPKAIAEGTAYSAIAASAGFVARTSMQKLKPWLERLKRFGHCKNLFFVMFNS